MDSTHIQYHPSIINYYYKKLSSNSHVETDNSYGSRLILVVLIKIVKKTQ